MSTAAVVFAWIGLVLGLVVLLTVVWLFSRVLRPALEVARYADDTLDAAEGIVRNLERVDELGRASSVATGVPARAAAYLGKLGLTTR